LKTPCVLENIAYWAWNTSCFSLSISIRVTQPLGGKRNQLDIKWKTQNPQTFWDTKITNLNFANDLLCSSGGAVFALYCRGHCRDPDASPALSSTTPGLIRPTTATTLRCVVVEKMGN
jgi:hypothetical protein